jgi:hypothetical protein
VFGGIAYFGLQQLGGFVVRRLANATDVYGTFAVVIGLLTWFHLLGQLTLLAAEINVVRQRRLYPRRLLGDKLTDGDRRALEGYLAAQVRDRRVWSAPAPAPEPAGPGPERSQATQTPFDGQEPGLAATEPTEPSEEPARQR